MKKKQERLPHAVSSKAWLDYWQNKESEKERKEDKKKRQKARNTKKIIKRKASHFKKLCQMKPGYVKYVKVGLVKTT